jgi:hypothetical protein
LGKLLSPYKISNNRGIRLSETRFRIRFEEHDMSWLDDLIGIGSGATSSLDAAGLMDAGSDSLWMPSLSYGFGGGASDSADALSFWGAEAPSAVESSPRAFNNYAERFGLTYDDYGPSMTAPTEPSMWDRMSELYAPIDRAASSPLGKFGIGGLGALVSAYGANRQNKSLEQARRDALAARAAALAQHQTSTAPVRVTNQRAALPSWGAGRPAFSGNSLAAMTPRSTNTMYAAEGGVARGQGGLCQACGGSAHYVKGGTAGQADKVPAMLSDGEYVMDADVVSALGDGNNAAGAKKLDKMRVGIRTHKRAAPATKIPPKAKAPEAYLKGAK